MSTKKKIIMPEDDFRFVWPKGTRPPDVPADKIITPKIPTPARLICVSDIHFPTHDRRVMAAVVAFMQDFKPNNIVLNGDIYDLYGLSSYSHEASYWLSPEGRLQAEFDSAQPFLKECVRVAQRTDFIPGNHEYRLERTIDANHALFGLRKFDLPTLAEMPPSIFKHEYGTTLEVGGIAFAHGDRIGGKFGIANAADYILKNRPGMSMVIGHRHKIDSKYVSVIDPAGGWRTLGAWSQGHMQDMTKVKYAGPSPGWVHGFTACEFWTVAGKPRYTVHQIAIIEGRFSFGGKLYDGNKL